MFDGFRFFAFVSEVHGHPALNFVLGERGQTPLHEFCFGGKGEETLAWATVSLRMLFPLHKKIPQSSHAKESGHPAPSEEQAHCQA